MEVANSLVMRCFAAALASLAPLAFATFASTPALADCIPGTGICASAGATIGIPSVQVGGQITIGIPPIVFPGSPPAAPPPQAETPAYPPPPPPPAYGYGYGYGRPAPAYGYAPRTPAWGQSRLGVDLRVDWAAASSADSRHSVVGMGGAGLGLRYRVVPHFGLEGGLDVLGGHDFNDNKRLEVAGTLGGLIYLNPRSRAQFYLSGGFLADHARASIQGGCGPGEFCKQGDLTYDHVGGYAGLGLEMFATRRLAFHLDARGVIRQHVGGDSSPEFTDGATGRTTNTSGGVVGSAGVVLYF